jgi:hypothetical protein
VTPDPATGLPRSLGGRLVGRMVVSVALLALVSPLIGGCSKDAGLQAIETDAHGYLCQQCRGKFYTGARVFLESKCPKCQQETLTDVIGHWCEKDKHLTIRPKVRGPEGAAVCEKCGAALKNALVSPREKDLLAWGATKTTPEAAR